MTLESAVLGHRKPDCLLIGKLSLLFSKRGGENTRQDASQSNLFNTVDCKCVKSW